QGHQSYEIKQYSLYKYIMGRPLIPKPRIFQQLRISRQRLSTVTKVYLLRGQGLLPALPAGRRAAAPGKCEVKRHGALGHGNVSMTTASDDYTYCISRPNFFGGK